MGLSKDLIQDFPKGPLSSYREQATFCWRRMKEFLESEDIVEDKYKIWKTLEKDALFKQTSLAISHEDLRKLTVLRANRIKDFDLFNFQRILENPLRYYHTLSALAMYDPSVLIRYSIQAQFFNTSVQRLGTKKHKEVVKQLEKEEIKGCLAVTEVAHGSDVKQLRTVATFDPRTQEFVLHTPDFEAAKCWVGNLGYSSTHATVFAQLYTPDGFCHGVHAFCTPLRDPLTMLPYPGVTLGDMGVKLGLNGIDNGFAMFTHHRIPKDCLLDKFGTVADDGKYVSSIVDPRKRFGATLGTLVAGRMVITSFAVGNQVKAISIAVRYAFSRKQFGVSEGVEQPIIDYQSQQYRLFPYLASAYAHMILAWSISEAFVQFFSQDDRDLKNFGVELHGLISAAKPVATWTAQRCIQEAREACGGHGYLACAGLGNLRNDNDANCTYEGENNVLIQQNSNWLLSIWKRRNQPFESPLGSVQFLYKQRGPPAVPATVEEVSKIPVMLSLYEWLICWLLEQTQLKYDTNLQHGQDSFTARNNCQVFHAKSLSLAYIEHFILKICLEKMTSAEPSLHRETQVLSQLVTLYGLTHLQDHLGDLYESGLAHGPALSRVIKEAVLQLCADLKSQAIPLVDAIAPPDFILNSALGNSNGELYKNLEQAFLEDPKAMERPAFWKELTGKFRSRL